MTSTTATAAPDRRRGASNVSATRVRRPAAVASDARPDLARPRRLARCESAAVHRVATPTHEVGPSKEEKGLAFKQVEAEMWAWDQEWSTVARMAIADRSLLRLLGIGRPGRPKGTGAGSTGRVDEPAEGDAPTEREEGA